MLRLQPGAERLEKGPERALAKAPPDGSAPVTGCGITDASGWHTRHPFFLAREGRYA
jgi:hypothetical protein